MTPKLIATTLLVATGSLLSNASTADAGERWRFEFDKRQVRQYELVREGREEGTLTWRETLRLNTGLKGISRQARIFAAYGGIDAYEANELREAQDQMTRRIFEYRNNADGRRRWWHSAAY